MKDCIYCDEPTDQTCKESFCDEPVCDSQECQELHEMYHDDLKQMGR
jgi:hypothetical protein